MNHIELAVKPILKEMGLFEGKEVSVKKVFEKYLEKFPKGIGPLGAFMHVVEHKFNLDIKKIYAEDKIDFVFSYSHNSENDILCYDPRKNI